MSKILDILKNKLIDPSMYIKHLGKTIEGYDIYTTASNNKICVGAQVYICNDDKIIQYLGGLSASIYLAQLSLSDN